MQHVHARRIRGVAQRARSSARALGQYGRYEPRTVGSSQHQEYWIPAEDLEAFNEHLVGEIEVVAEFRNTEDGVATNHFPRIARVMNATPSVVTAPAILVVTGASGAGKSTLVRRLGALELPGVGCYEFDTIGIPSAAEITARFGGGEGFQAWALDAWVARLARNDDRVATAVLDASVRPRAALDALARHGIARGAVVLVDCDYAERNARLRGPRGQPELATAQMDGWAAYLRGQADALDVPVVDTTGARPEASLVALRAHVDALLQGVDSPHAE